MQGDRICDEASLSSSNPSGGSIEKIKGIASPYVRASDEVICFPPHIRQLDLTQGVRICMRKMS